jgi:hypothetical protein
MIPGKPAAKKKSKKRHEGDALAHYSNVKSRKG